jgi:hypothetical protein
MIQQDKIAKHPRLFKTLTGLSAAAFGNSFRPSSRLGRPDWIAGTPGGCAADVVAVAAGDA